MTTILRRAEELGEEIAVLNESQAAFGIVTKTGRDYHEAAPCHATLSDFDRRIDKEDKDSEDEPVIYVVDSVYKDVSNSEAMELAYLDYLINDSFYSPHITVLGTVESIWKRGYLIMTADCPANVLAGFLIAKRMAWERPANVEMWYKLSSAGVNKDLAQLISYGWEMSNTGVYKKRPDSSHVPLNLNVMTEKDWKSFCNKKCSGVLLENYSTSSHYMRIHQMHCADYSGDLYEGGWHEEAHDMLEAKKGAVSSKEYLFFRPNVEDVIQNYTNIPLREFIENVLIFEKKLIGEKK